MAKLYKDENGFRYYKEIPDTAVKVDMKQFKTHITSKKYYIIENPRTKEYELYKYNGVIDNDLEWFIDNGCVYLSKRKL